jgi:precorrin isomerase
MKEGSDFDTELFTKVCTLEAKLELNEKKLWELEKLLKQALEIIIDTNRVANGISKTNSQN